ncbi:MAG TPA: hypothetical protein VGM39_12870 [Kofleriaceae bacterium]|jgi:hypothetical protein
MSKGSEVAEEQGLAARMSEDLEVRMGKGSAVAGEQGPNAR